MKKGMQNDQLETMLTARQVADFLQVSISTVRRWSDGEMLKFYRIGSRGDRRYQREDVLRFVQKSTGPSWTGGVKENLSTHVGASRPSGSRARPGRRDRKPVASK